MAASLCDSSHIYSHMPFPPTLLLALETFSALFLLSVEGGCRALQQSLALLHTHSQFICVSPNLVLARTAEQEPGLTLPAGRDPVKSQNLV